MSHGDRESTSDAAGAASENRLKRQLESLTERIALALAMLDEGNAHAARGELAELLAPRAPSAHAATGSPAPRADSRASRGPGSVAQLVGWDAPPPAAAGKPEFDEGVADAEIDLAFEAAETEAEQMRDVNSVAEEALARESLDAPEALFEATEHPAFATASMADVLEEQGDVAAAGAIRDALHGGQTAADEGEDEGATDARWDATIPPVAPGQDPAGTGDRPIAALPSRARTLATLECWLVNVRREVA